MGCQDPTGAATRWIVGFSSLISSRRFASSVWASVEIPVMFLPGFARLSTMPAATGSPIAAATIGILGVALFAASAAAVPQIVTSTSTLRPTSSDASFGNRSTSPSASTHRSSVLEPSTKPRSLKPCRNASTHASAHLVGDNIPYSRDLLSDCGPRGSDQRSDNNGSQHLPSHQLSAQLDVTAYRFLHVV